MQIEHDPREPTHHTLVIMAGIALALTLCGVLIMKFGLEQVIAVVPVPFQALAAGVMLGFVGGMRVGWWDAERYHGLNKESTSRRNVLALVRYVAYLLALSPFAVILIPRKSWSKARVDGEGVIPAAVHAAAGLLIGLMITLACVVSIAIFVQTVM